MKKSYILTFAISVVILVTITVVALMILLPQQSTVIDSSLSKYDSIKKSDFVYEKTKDITKDALVHEYTITSEEMDKFRNEQKYVSGNSDPFTPSNVNTNNNNGGKNNNTNNNSNNTNGNNSGNNNNASSSTNTNNSSNSNSNTSNSNSTTQKITNSNGGQPNPPSTNK